MKKVFFFALIAVISFSACSESEFDEQMESAAVMNKGTKTDKAEVKASGAAKNKKNQGIMLIDELTTRSAAEGPIRRPLGDTYEEYNLTKPIKR